MTSILLSQLLKLPLLQCSDLVLVSQVLLFQGLFVVLLEMGEPVLHVSKLSLQLVVQLVVPHQLEVSINLVQWSSLVWLPSLPN